VHKLPIETRFTWLHSRLLLLMRLLQLLLLQDGQWQSGLGTRVDGVEAVPVEGHSAGGVGRRLAPHRTHSGELSNQPVVLSPLHHRGVHALLNR